MTALATVSAAVTGIVAAHDATTATPTTSTPISAPATVGKQYPAATTQTSWVQTVSLSYNALYPVDRNLLFLTLSVQTVSGQTWWMERFILRFIQKLVKEGQPITARVDKHGNIYVTKGPADFAGYYPTMIAHTDTVHDIVRNSHYQVRSDHTKMWAVDPITGKDRGIGGDDKVGIFIALTLLSRLPVFKASFVVDEEIGCRGSNKVDMDFFTDASFVLQCDRKGMKDFVNKIGSEVLFGDVFGAAIKPMLVQFGYSLTMGGMTDVQELKERGLRVAAANMSCGYFSPHQSSETVGIHDVQRTFDLCYTICTELGDRQWQHYIPPRPRVVTPATSSFGVQKGTWKDGKFVPDAPKPVSVPAVVSQNTYPNQYEEMWNNRMRNDNDGYAGWLGDADMDDWERRRGGGGTVLTPAELIEKNPNEYYRIMQELNRAPTVADLLKRDKDMIADAILRDADAALARRQGNPLTTAPTLADIEDSEDLIWEMNQTGDIVPVCPLCKQSSTILWDPTEHCYFCMSCQLPIEGAPVNVEGGEDEDGDDTVIAPFRTVPEPTRKVLIHV